LDLHTAVPAPVVVRSIVVVFTISFVVFLIVRDEIIKSESVVTCHKIDALLRLSGLVTIDFVTAKQTVSETLHRPVVGPQEAPYIITKVSIPLLPAIPDKATR
jgi:hypothetical protein